MAQETFNPEDHMWVFVEYYKYGFSFCTTDKPTYHAHVGGDRGDIYRYMVTCYPMSWEQVMDGVELIQGDWEGCE